MAKNIWHSLKLEEVFSGTQSRDTGLSQVEVEDRLKKWGANELPKEKPYSKLKLFVSQFNNPLMYILLCTIAISIVLKHYSDAVFIVIVMLANTVVGFYQEYKASDAINSLKKLVVIKSTVLRDNVEKEVASEQLVVGDIILIHAGDKIAVDARIIESRGFKVNEAALTGESMPADKKAGTVAANVVLADRKNMVFMGTLAEEGFAKAVVVATGVATEMGRIVTMLAETEEAQTPLQTQIAKLAKLLGAFVMLVVGMILIIGLWRYDDPNNILLASLSLAVAAVPSGLLPGITLILVLGMHRILKQHGLVRKLVANETLGSVTIICTDKTGTLTEGKMQVTHFISPQKELTGNDLLSFQINMPDPQADLIKKLGRIIVLNNDAYIENPQAQPADWVIRGKLTEQALLRAGTIMGFDKKILEQEYLLLDKIYFSSDKKYSATLREFDDGKIELFVVGAPEVLLGFAASHHRETAEFKKLESRIEELSRQGLRVLAGAYAEFNGKPKYKKAEDLVKNLNLVGLVALEDPIRAEVVDAIRLTKKAGIRTTIVTGDHKLTALAIAKKIGLRADAANVLEGTQIEAMSDDELRVRAPHTTAFVRVSPQHKLRIVAALQSIGEIVAMVGDGVNDAPALKAANIGVAVNSGTDTAKEVADLVLLDNGFSTIVKAVEQGRVILANIRRIFVYLIVDDFSELFLFVVAMIMGLPLPLLPAQILWVNLVQDGLPDLALTAEKESKYAMDHSPPRYGEPIVTKPIKLWLASVSVISGLAAFGLFFAGLQLNMDLGKIQTMVFALIGLDSLFFAFCVRSFHRPIWRLDIFNNRWLTGASVVSFLLLMMAIYAPFMQKILQTHNLLAGEWIAIFAITIVEIIFIEITKKIFISEQA